MPLRRLSRDACIFPGSRYESREAAFKEGSKAGSDPMTQFSTYSRVTFALHQTKQGYRGSSFLAQPCMRDAGSSTPETGRSGRHASGSGSPEGGYGFQRYNCNGARVQQMQRDGVAGPVRRPMQVAASMLAAQPEI